MTNNAILLSVRPQYADKIFEGSKRVELRRVRPVHLRKGTLVLIYVSSPIKSIAGAFKAMKIIEEPLEELWGQVKDVAGISREEFNTYFEGISKGIGIFFDEVWYFPEPIKLQELEEQTMVFHPPQGFRYATQDELMLASLKLADFVGEVEYIVQTSFLDDK